MALATSYVLNINNNDNNDNPPRRGCLIVC
jgi:hypothetical protein